MPARRDFMHFCIVSARVLFRYDGLNIMVGITVGGFMGTGIIVCGLNGSGKSTLGKALAEKSDFHFIDIEDI